MEWFPLGLDHYIIGGILVGFGVAVIYLTTGIVAGASSFFSSTWSWFSRVAYFNQPMYTNARVWRLVFTIGLIIGAAIFALASQDLFVTQVQGWRLFVGGMLVGFGTRLSRGCTSGHGICGLASWSFPSVVAVLTFLAIAITTALLVQVLGVSP